MNHRGNILITVLIGFVILGAAEVVVTSLIDMRSRSLRRSNMLQDVNHKMTYLQRIFANPQMCQWAFRATGGGLATWGVEANPDSVAQINGILVDPDQSGPQAPALTWNVGTPVGSDLTLTKIEVRQPGPPATYPTEPARSSTALSRLAPSYPTGTRVKTNYHSYLAKLILYFQSSVVGGDPAPGALYLNLLVNDSSKAIEQCYPSINNPSNNLSILNGMGSYCNSANSNPMPYKWNGSTNTWDSCTPPGCPSCPAACTVFSIVGFSSAGVPICQCGCLPDVTVGAPPPWMVSKCTTDRFGNSICNDFPVSTTTTPLSPPMPATTANGWPAQPPWPQ